VIDRDMAIPFCYGSIRRGGDYLTDADLWPKEKLLKNYILLKASTN